jgi:excisionase family DNA binding protein
MKAHYVQRGTVDAQGYLTTDDIAKQLNISVSTVRRYIRAGKLKAVKLERAYRIRPRDFEQFLKEREIRRSPQEGSNLQ